MNEDIVILEPETDSLQKADDLSQQTFVTDNAEYFAQSLAPLNQVFRNSGMMNIVSEEKELTFVVGIRTVGEDGELEVDCSLLESDQTSLRDCLSAIFI